MGQDVWASLVSNSLTLLPYRRQLDLASEEEAWTALAGRVASARTWGHLPTTRLVLRLGDHPILALVGEYTEVHTPLLSNCLAGLRHSLAYIRWIDWEEALAASKNLAKQLVRSLGEDLAVAQFEAIPRGGYIVLGILAQLLDLAPEQMVPGGSTRGELLIVVDDCSISGARFGEVLSDRKNSRIVFAHLASHPSLRASVIAQETRVEACLAAIDLLEPVEHPEADSHHRHTWARRLETKKRFWLGQTEHICFPWNEPDRPVWDPVADRVLPSWPVIPKARCLKGSVFSRPEIPLHIHGEPEGAVRLPAGVVYYREADFVALANLETGVSLRLEGTAARFWEALVTERNLEAVGSALIQEYEVEPEACRREVEQMLSALEAQGFLQRVEGSG